MSKWPNADDCRTVAKHLAARLAEDAALRRRWTRKGSPTR
ncbi:hypothetical protein L665_00058 [Ralstonia solanacearum SD54]|nr:hypothetical protein L665_00058 [Ralstonia solanacearum SD54]